MSTSRTAVLNAVWAPGKAKRTQQSMVSCQKRSQVLYSLPTPATVVTVLARSWHQNGMMLPGHLADRRAERGGGGALWSLSAFCNLMAA